MTTSAGHNSISWRVPTIRWHIFYNADSVLYCAMKEAFGGTEKFLVKFKAKGFFLDDLVLAVARDGTAHVIWNDGSA